MVQLKATLLANPEFQKLREAIRSHLHEYPDYFISADLIIFKGAIWVDSKNPFIISLLHEYHATPIGGHFGIKKTLHRLQSDFRWHNMVADVKAFVRRYAVCQQVKHLTRRSAGLLQPIPVPTGTWENISMDFVTHLPASHGFTAVMVMVDRFSKSVHLGALPTHFTAFKVATLFMDTVCKHHGFPRSIISDRDPIFISSFWRELFKMTGTTLRMSTAYHPQTDGQTEVMNRTLEQYLCSFVHHQPATWYKLLTLMEWSNNTSHHTSTGLTPYEVVYGKPPPSPPMYLQGLSRNDAVNTILRTREETHAILQRKLVKAQEAMKHFADQKRRDVVYEVDQLVYVKLRPHRQSSLRSQPTSKLTKRYFGPYPVMERIGNVAYRLKLPEGSKIHPVFYCSLLQPHHGSKDIQPTPLPQKTEKTNTLLFKINHTTTSSKLRILQHMHKEHSFNHPFLISQNTIPLNPEDSKNKHTFVQN